MDILTHIVDHFEQYLIVVLFVTLFFKESIVSYINAKLGRETQTPEWGKKATNEITRLADYSNHDTTERLNILIDMEKIEHQNNQEMRDIMKDMGRTLMEIKEYGIPCRDKK